MSGSGLPATNLREEKSVRSKSWRRASGRRHIIGHLPQYDVRVRRELAHRRLVLSMLRRAARVVGLHVVDIVAVALAVALAAKLTGIELVAILFPAPVAFVLIGLNVRGSYRAGGARRDTHRLLTGVLVGLGALIVSLASLRSSALPLAFVAIFGLTAIALLIVERRLVNAIIHQAYAHGIGLRRALIVTRAHEIDELLSGLSTAEGGGRPAEDQVIVGYVTPEATHDGKALGHVDAVAAILDANDVSELLIATSLQSDVVTEIANACFERGVQVLVVPFAAQPLLPWAEFTRVGRLPAYHLHPARPELPGLVLKRATDLVLAAVGLIVAAPLMLLIAVGIKLESRGPVFFRQRRVGLGGREFMMWKFRSMGHEAESKQTDVAHLNTYADGRLFKLRRDPRITRVGRFLRRFSLDELPQLFNILAGDMSLVGPRPPLPSEVGQYEPHHLLRLSVVPGLTGPWQVNGRNLITDFEEVVRLERDYIERWSLRSDMEIIVRTVGVVLDGKGAY